ncbi:MAG: chorismate synthase [Chlamydiales bacterium]
MASNSFGQIFRVTTWGESHGKAIGAVIDGCPARLPISEQEIQNEMFKRAPGNSRYTSPRKEEDRVEILSGVFEGMTTGAPISIIIYNKDYQSSAYEDAKKPLRPGHAHYTYLEKYGIFDHYGGGRASARETACRVAAGAIAKKILSQESIEVLAYLNSIQDIVCSLKTTEIHSHAVENSPLFCPDHQKTKQMETVLLEAQNGGDSLGGVVAFRVINLPTGLGDPIYEKLEANLAKAMLSIPGTKGFEIGSGFKASEMLGSEHNDRFVSTNGTISCATNYAGGILGGISTGMPIEGKVAFKPPSGIKIPMETVDQEGNVAQFKFPEQSRHDPCIAIRAVPVVEAMAALVITDSLLMKRTCRI